MAQPAACAAPLRATTAAVHPVVNGKVVQMYCTLQLQVVPPPAPTVIVHPVIPAFRSAASDAPFPNTSEQLDSGGRDARALHASLPMLPFPLPGTSAEHVSWSSAVTDDVDKMGPCLESPAAAHGIKERREVSEHCEEGADGMGILRLSMVWASELGAGEAAHS
jgi:hypothetical protein